MNHSDFFYCALPIGYAMMCGILILIMLFQTKETIKIDKDRAVKDMQLVDAIKVLIQKGTPALSEYAKQAEENTKPRGLLRSALNRNDELGDIGESFQRTIWNLQKRCADQDTLIKKVYDDLHDCRAAYKNDPVLPDIFSRLINMIENA